MTVNDCKIIELPKYLDARGNLSFAQNNDQIPFEIKRTYWLYDVPGGVARGGHAEIENEELVIALSGSFEIMVDDGECQKTFTLNRSYYGLYIPKGLWREIREFSTNALALEFGSTTYTPNDYIRNYEAFKAYSKAEKLHNVDSRKVMVENMPIHEKKYNVFDSTVIEFERHHSDRRGNLSVIENGSSFPFDVKRVYYLYDVPGGESRGSHAHRDLEQLIVAASGSFKVTLDDGIYKRTFFLNRPYQGLYVKPGMWRDLEDFSSGAVCMVLASDVYRAEDYIRSYDDFIEYRNNK